MCPGICASGAWGSARMKECVDLARALVGRLRTYGTQNRCVILEASTGTRVFDRLSSMSSFVSFQASTSWRSDPLVRKGSLQEWRLPAFLNLWHCRRRGEEPACCMGEKQTSCSGAKQECIGCFLEQPSADCWPEDDKTG